MIASETQFIPIPINGGAFELIRRMSGGAELGGKSHIRDDDDRKKKLKEDQLVGQLGTAALHLYWLGHLTEYRRQRLYQNQNPRKGDGGCDLPFATVDVKSSKVRTQLPYLKHRLSVRPDERHPGWTYILCLVELHENSARNVLIGWATDEMLPREPEKDGQFSGAYVLPADQLNPLPPVKWWVE